MNRTQHPSNNDVLAPPKGWDNSALAVSPLPITRTEIEGQPAIISFWRPTKDEIESLCRGALVALWTIGTNTPPVAIEVETK
jgi:hypothetical protein